MVISFLGLIVIVNNCILIMQIRMCF